MKKITFYGHIFTLHEITRHTPDYLVKVATSSVHQFGSGPFCKFDCPIAITNKKGIYIIVVDGDVKYVGRCTTTFKERIQTGYGRISPHNCSKYGGQLTNCHINSELNKAFVKGQKVEIGILPMDNESDICDLERWFLNQMRASNPYWNLYY